MSELPAHVDHPRCLAARRAADRGSDPVVRQARTARRGRATGVREIEATAFVSPSKVPALADAAELAAELLTTGSTASSSPRWWPARTAPSGPSRRACDSIEYVVSAADGHSRANVGRSTAESTALIAEIIAHRARQRRLGGGHHRHRMGLPVRRPDTAAAGPRHRRRRPATAAPTGSRSPTPSAPRRRGASPT